MASTNQTHENAIRNRDQAEARERGKFMSALRRENERVNEKYEQQEKERRGNEENPTSGKGLIILVVVLITLYLIGSS